MLLRNPGGLIGVAILTIAIAVALVGPLLFPTSPWRMVQRPFLPPFTMANLPLGTDALGRDVCRYHLRRACRCWSACLTLAALAVGTARRRAGYFGGKSTMP
jgi:peptide/nickel transport system permease protein